MGGLFVERLERGIGGVREHPGEVSWWFAFESGEGAYDFNKRQVMQICAPCPDAWFNVLA